MIVGRIRCLSVYHMPTLTNQEKGSYVRLKIHVADSPTSPFHQTVVQLHDGLSWDLV